MIESISPNKAVPDRRKPCPRCGAPVPSDAPANLCPSCLIQGGFSEVAGLENPSGEGTELQTLAENPEDQENLPQQLGAYEILEMIARGGMGVVYKARHKGLDRVVALKMIRSGVLASRKDVERFQREARAAAKLHHPNIVAIHDIGEQGGQHFYTMDYVPGDNLAHLARANPFSPGEAAEITAGVAAAIHYAHQHGILHRDIKPANVILTPEQEPRVLDFGLALLVTDESSLTLSGTPLGSPSYMSPEQAAGQTRTTDARSDVYSLGALLYELLTGRPPFQAASTVETLQLVVGNEPVSPKRLNPALPRDLETICLKCLEKSPDRRYQSAQELADELERYIRDEPILARPVAPTEKVWRWCRRKPAVAALATATALLLFAVAIGSPVAAWRISSARNAERQQWQRAEENADELIKSLYAADMRTAWQALQEDNLLVARESIYKYLPALGLPVSGELKGAAALAVGDLYARRVKREQLGWEWRRLWALCQSDESFTLHGDGLEIRCAVFSPDSRWVATGRERTVYVTDAETKEQVAALGGFSDVIDNGAIAFSNNGRLLAARGGTNILIWKVGEWSAPVQRMEGAPNQTHGNAVVFSPDDRRFVARVPGGLGIWDTSRWEMRLVEGGFGLGMYLHYSADGKWLAASDWNDLKILDTRSLEVVQVIPREQEGHFRMFSLASTAGRGFLAAGYLDGIVRLWEVESWREVARFKPHPSFTFGLAFSPDGSVLVTGGSDQLIKFWDVSGLTNGFAAGYRPELLRKPKGHEATEFPGRIITGEDPLPIKKFKGHYASIHGVAFAPNGKWVVSASKDGTAKLWSPHKREGSETLPGSQRLAWFSPDGEQMITLNRDGRLHRWDTSNQEDLGMIGPDLFESRAWRISESGEILAVGRKDGEVEIWDLITGERTASFAHLNDKITHVALSGDGTLVAAASERNPGADAQPTVRIWERASGRVAGTYTNAFGPLAFSSDRARLVTTRLDGRVVVWNLANGEPLLEIEENFTWIGGLALSPDGRLLVTGSEEPLVNISDLASGKRMSSLKGSRMCIVNVAFTPDAHTLATCTVDGEVKFWHTATGKEIFTVRSVDPFNSFLFSPNGEYMAVSRGSRGKGDEWMELWRAPSYEEIIAAEEAKMESAERHAGLGPALSSR